MSVSTKSPVGGFGGGGMQWLQLGLSGLSAFAGYSQSKQNAKEEAAYQAYQNHMTMLSNAVAQNGITDNEVFSNEAFAQEGLQIQKQDAVSIAQASVQAAASGVTGISVNDTLTNINRQAAGAESQREEDLQHSWVATDDQRQNASMSAAMHQNYSPIQMPSLGANLMQGLGSGIENIGKSYPGGLGAWTDAQGITGKNGIFNRISSGLGL